MDKHIYTCDTNECIINEGFIYILTDSELEWDAKSHKESDPVCPLCHQDLRHIESINEQGENLYYD